jgi:hypothetical protein
MRSGIWIATAAVLLASFLFVRLLVAPIDLGFARDLVTAQANALLPGWEVSFREAEVGWDWRRVRPWVSLQDIRFTDRRNRLTAYVPEASVSLTVTELFTKVAISDVEVERAQVHILDLGGFSDASDSGGMTRLFSTSGTPTPEVLRPVTEAFSRFGARLLRTAPALRGVTFSSVSVIVERGEGLAQAHLSLPRLQLSRDAEIISLNALMDARLADTPTQVRLRGKAEPFIGNLELSLGFTELRPTVIAQLASLPEAVSYFNVPLALDLDLDLSAEVGLERASFSATLDEGTISDPVSFPFDSLVKYGLITGRYEAGEDTLVLEQIEIATEGPVVRGEGLIYWMKDQSEPAVQLGLRVDDAQIADVLKYWPIKVNPDGSPRGARAWIDDHIDRGTIRNARFEVDWTPTNGGGFQDGSAYRLTFSYDELDTYYLLSMPPIVGAAGSGELTHDVFELSIDSGHIGTMPVGGSSARMTNIDVRDGAIGHFDIRLSADVPEVMALISHDPLRVPQKLGFDVARVGGQARIRTLLTVPLVKDVAADDVHYDVTATILETSVQDLLGGEGLRRGDITLRVDPDSVSAEGIGQLNGVPLSLYWREDLAAGRTDPAADTTEIVLSGSLDENDMAAMGVDVSDYLTGKTLAEATFIGRNFAFKRGYFSADASMASLNEKRLAWQKPVAVPATVTGTIFFDDGQTRISPLVVTGEEIDVRADLTFAGEALRGTFDVASLGRNKFHAVADQNADGDLKVVIKGESFDLGPILAAEQEGKAVGMAEGLDRLDLDVNVATLLAMNGEEVDNLRLNGNFIGGAPERMSASGLVHGTSKAIALDIVPGGEGSSLRNLTIATPDGGHLLRAFGLFSHLRDGEMTLEGKTSGWGKDLHIDGRMRVKGAVMVSKNKLGPAVTEGLIEGLNDYLKDETVQLDTIDMPFDYSEGLLDITAMKANGPTLGMTMEGQISARAEKINVNGVFVPAYGLNALLGKIPLLGSLLTGGEGKGVFGVTYRVKGPTANPEFSVNPLSGIAPGFLRLLFEGRKGNLGDVVIPEEEPAPEEPGQDPATGEGADNPEKENPEPQAPGVPNI